MAPEMKFLLIYLGIGFISNIIGLIITYHDEGGIKTKSLLICSAIMGLCWPLGVPLVAFVVIRDELEKIERKNNGFLIRKPTPSEREQKKIQKFNQQVQRAVQ